MTRDKVKLVSFQNMVCTMMPCMRQENQDAPTYGLNLKIMMIDSLSK